MGLPSKKQLHKHKRGTRKALDTLDAMDKSEDTPPLDEGVEELVTSKKSKKSETPPKKEKEKEKTQNGEIEHKPADQAQLKKEDPAEETIKLEDPIRSDSDTPAVQPEQPESADQEETPASQDKQDFASEPEKKESVVGPTDNNNADSDNENLSSSNDYDDEEFEDTQKDKYLTFHIGDESFGFAIKYVTEIIVIHKITEVPDTPSFVRGVINLRGMVIPVIDVRHRFGLELREYDDRTCIIVVDYEETAVGLIVDTVNEVVDIPEDQIDPPPRIRSGIEASYIWGMGKVGKRVNILLNLEKVLFVEEILAKRRELDDN